MQSFIKLLNEHPLHKITVKQIVEDCGVNRNTFYYYFEDIYSLTEEVFKDAASTSEPLDWASNTWQENFTYIMTFCSENKKLLHNIYTSMSRELLTKYLAEISQIFVEGLVRFCADGTDASEEDIAVVVQLQKYTILGVIDEWMANGMKTQLDSKVFTLGPLFIESITLQLKSLAEI